MISFFFNDTATTEIYTLSLHDALPICLRAGATEPLPQRRRAGLDQAAVPGRVRPGVEAAAALVGALGDPHLLGDRKSTRLNSSHSQISYAVFCLKKKKKQRKLR